ncbi:hypothetical protein B0T22DRAFT_438693 [Podospora appendiculata]|uniref:Uncharacterized protein n=1 Tax=Podospora appendiculata TaxID=314037 RepID=A0AAE1CIM2_9PEZI|nr:hypothetical protein B0T22DRAFT_438693 [Podospora appendiculata]
MVAAAPPSLAPAVLRYRRTSVIIAVLYLAVLIIPWILTCAFGRLKPVDELKSILPYRAIDDGRWTIAVAVLNAVAMLASLPAIYSLLARAAVVTSQRRRDGQSLNARQLFGLADGGFLVGMVNDHPRDSARSRLTFLGGMLIVIAIVLPPIRSGLVNQSVAVLGYAPETKNDESPNSWTAFKIGTDATLGQITSGEHDQTHSPTVIAKTRLAIASSHPAEWLPLAPRDPETGLFFASALPANTSTGMYRQHGLRMNSTASCVRKPLLKATFECQGNGTFWTRYENNGLTVHVCLRTPIWWKSAFYLQDERASMSQELNETVVLSVATTTLGLFELGNTFNSGKAGPLLRAIPEYHELRATGFVYPTDYYRDTPDKPYFTGLSDVNYDAWTQDYSSGDRLGPLASTMRALFARGSYFSIAHSLCRAAPILILLYYIYTVPTWTATLDAMAIARISHQLQDNGAIGRIWLQDVAVDKLEHVDGLIGVVESPEQAEEGRSAALLSADDSVWIRPNVTVASRSLAANTIDRTSNISTSPSPGEVDSGFEQMELDTYRSDVLPPTLPQTSPSEHGQDDHDAPPPGYTARRETEPPAYSSGVTGDDYRLQVGATGLINRGLAKKHAPKPQDQAGGVV